MSRKAAGTKPEENAEKGIDGTIVLINAIRQVGIPGSSAGVIFFILLTWTSASQQEQIINTYLLFANNNGHYVCGAIISALIVINIATIVFDRRMLLIEKKDVRRLEAWIERFQLAEKEKG